MPSIERVPSGRYRARYRDLSGRSRSRTFDTKADARRFLEETGTAMRRGEWVDPTVARSLFEVWAAEWWATTVHLRPSTRHGYETALNARVLPFFRGRQLASIERVDVKRFVAELVAKGYAPKTIRQSVLVLSLIMQTAQESHVIRENPATRHRLPRSVTKDPVFLTPEQVNALAAACPEPYGLVMLFGAYSGLRPAEICGVRVGRVDFLKRSVEVTETLGVVDGRLVEGPTKTYARRTVPLPPFLCEALAEYLATRTAAAGHPLDPSERLFLGPTGGPLRRTYLHTVLRRAASAAGLPSELRVHDLRHTCASFLIAAGVHPKAMQERLGHSTITVTLDTYGHLFPSLQEVATQRLEELYRASEMPLSVATAEVFEQAPKVLSQDTRKTQRHAKDTNFGTVADTTGRIRSPKHAGQRP